MAPAATLRLIRRAAAAARERKTPFYLFDATRARERIRAWKRLAERHRIALFYPYKCNRHPALLDLAAREGLGAEVTARMDLESALGRGLSGDRIVVQGPALDRAILDRALGAGALVVADAPEAVDALRARSRALGLSPRYLARLRPAAAEEAQRRFGMTAREIARVVKRVRREGGLELEGLAFHLGTGIPGLAPYRSAIREAAGLARELRDRGLGVRTLDAGGGFAATGEARIGPTARPRGRPVAASRLLASLAALSRLELPQARLLLEPGRALASDVFHLVTRVLGVRRKGGRRVYVDASRLSHAFFVARGRHGFRPVPRRGSRALPSEVAGPLPVALDVLSPAERVGEPREGDLLLIESVGAYNLIAANAWAGEPPEVVGIR